MTHDDLDYTLSCLRRSVENGSTWTLYPAGAAALVAEVERLRAEALGLRAEVSYLRACVPPVHPGDYGHEAWTETVRAAVDAERAAVVAWLREQRAYGTDELMGQGFATVCGILADAIERGEHRREEDR